MPYFPTSEVWMQVKEPPKMVYVVPPPQWNSAGPRWNDSLTQSTCDVTLAVLWHSTQGDPPPPFRQVGSQAQHGTGENVGPSSPPQTHV